MFSLIALFCVVSIGAAQTNPGCLRGWTYFTKSNKCFKVFGGKDDIVRPTTWAQAEQSCTTFSGGHLASFHSEDEISFVVGLSQQAGWDNGEAGEIHVGHTHIGNGQWKWTDGSPWTYTKWWDGHEIGNNWDIQTQLPRGILHTRQVATSTMWIRNGGNSYAFACQMPPSTDG